MPNDSKDEVQRSPELLKLEEEFVEMRKHVTIRTHEPNMGGCCSVEEVIGAVAEVAENYEPSGYLKTAPRV